MSEHTSANGSATVTVDGDGIATLTLTMSGKVNKLNTEFGEALHDALTWIKEHANITGIIVASGHKDFCVGGDIDKIYQERDPARMMERLRDLNGLFRMLETMGVPVVAAINGSALGGGYELALSCHHRVALNSPKVQVGLPEVSLGVMPGAGGTQRLPRLIGIQPALEVILAGKMVRAPRAAKMRMVDALADGPEAVLAAARQWILDNPRAHTQPWDRKGFAIPGPAPDSADGRNILMAAAAMLRKKTAGVYPGPERALSAVQEGLALSFERALEVEARHFTYLATGDQAKDMIRTIWFHRTAAEKHEGLPRTEDARIQKIGILGAGMMGAGIAYVSAVAGYEVVLKDIKQEAVDAGLAHCQAQARKARHLSDERRAEILGRITGTLALDDLDGCDLIVEAVVENIEVKHMVLAETEPKLARGGIWASNTSAIPIGDLARPSQARESFIGLHFFSPVEKMQLVEVIRGPETSDETVARALGYIRKIKKLPIVVNDGYAFYTTRVFSAYILEAAQLVAEGHDPVVLEWAARQAGMVVPPLQVFDEVTLSLATHAFSQGRQYGRSLDLPGVTLVEKLVERGRTGKAAGAGFYEYRDDGKRTGLWHGLADLVTATPDETGVDHMASRLLGLQALEAARCVEEGIVREARDAEVGAVFGVGFAPNTGGPLSFIDRQGVAEFTAAMEDLARRYGERFTPPQLLRDMARDGKTFFPGV